MKLMSLMMVRNSEWREGWRQENCGSGIEAEKRSLWPLADSRYMASSVCQAFTCHLKNGSVAMRRHAFMLFRNSWATLDIAASSTPIWVIPPQIPSTGELDIGQWQKHCAIALTDVQNRNAPEPTRRIMCRRVTEQRRPLTRTVLSM